MNDEEVINLSKATVYVFSDSVLCLGRVRQFPQSNDEWETKLQWCKNSMQYGELDRIEGEPMDFEWMIYPGFTTLLILLEIQKINDGLGLRARTIPGKDHLHVDVQRLFVGRSKQRESVCC